MSTLPERMHNPEDALEAMRRMTLPQVLAMQAGRLGDRTAIREKAYGIWQTYSWADYYSHVRRVGMGLLSIGLCRGDHVGIITNNHPEWLFSELGAQAVGGVTLNLFTSSVADEIASALGRIQASYVIVEDQEQADKLIEARRKLGHVRKVIYMDPTGMRSLAGEEWLISFRDLLELGNSEDVGQPGRFEKEMGRGSPKEVALMLLTSGTTGIPKLAMLTHRNLTSMAANWNRSSPAGVGSDWLSMTPPAWIVDQMWGMGVALLGGMVMNFPETPDTISEDFREIGPSILITSSRFWEDLASRIRVRMSDAGAVRKKMFELAEDLGKRCVDLENAKSAVPLHLRILRAISSVAVYKPLLDRIGCSHFVSAYTGGHPISPDVIRFFRAMGLNLKQCYGLTEAGGIFQVQPDGEVKLETVGKPLPGVRVQLSDEEEVMVSGDSIFAGYYRDFEATSAAFHNGWLKTGDAGFIDREGHLLIIGRKSEIIRNKSGAAFSPDFIETRLKFSPYIKEAVVFGEGRPFITALINIDPGNVGSWAEERMIPYTTYTDLSQQPAVMELIRREIEEVNGQLPDHMKIRRFILLYKLLDADDEELTRTGKVRRQFVYGLYLRLIEAMYGREKELSVQGKVRYRDGRVGKIETTVKIADVKQ
ncbi:MAG: AMP-binding protein [Syntrophales bacterium]|nr:AMP-binding protein [Syntrophales bacterium]MDD5531827.1 AMP-binding protein [Syntrophales bacterium]